MKFKIPMYNATVHIVVANDIVKARKKYAKLLEPCKIEHYSALFSSNGNLFALFFSPKRLTHELIGHEICHLVMGILDWNNIKTMTTRDDEHTAILTGHVAKKVYKLLKGYKIT
ncbi:MAG: hypothetical protein M0R80_26665 [Proteobacteria bacterium]|nr:hypothetical protein [Pseudomonadota bacterium]